MKILLLGLSHKTAPLAIREQLSFTPTMLRSALTHFDSMHSQAHVEGVLEGVILSTCNRLEVYTRVSQPEVAREALVKFLSQACDIPPERFVDHLYVLQDEEAVRHLMRVAAGLDSMVLGEPQILGQITTAYEAALSQNAVGTVLSALFRAAIHAGKRVRTETAIGMNPASISSVAANTACELLGDLSQRRVLLIGVGKMGAIAARALIKRGVSKIVVANRTYQNALELAQELNGQAITFQQLSPELARADIIITATGAPHTILNRELLEPAVAVRGSRPLFIIDIAVPRDVDPDVTTLPNVHLRDIDSLQDQAEMNTAERRAEIPNVERIVEEETSQFVAWYQSRDVVPTITTMRRWVEEIRRQELERLFHRLDLDERARQEVDRMTHRLVNKIMHEPTTRLKQEAVMGNGVEYTSALRYLFGLDEVAHHN
ncbi:MAG: glutamyl-tRNA reductase [Chloroflexi bacterium]|nr:MAG: glutamyl-tRNA reductase [Chloroflexota bacterium]